MLRSTCWLLIGAAFLFVSFPVVGAAQEGESDGVPKMVLPVKIFNFEEVSQGDSRDTRFKVINEGTATLIIRAVKPACGCTVASFDREIAPGATGLIKVTFDTRGFKGPVSKSILVSSNDPDKPTARLVIKARVQPFIEVLPRSLVRFNGLKGEDLRQKVTLATEIPQDFKVTKIESDQPYLTATSRRLGADELIPGKHDRQWEITLKVGREAPNGLLRGKITVHTDHPKAPTAQITVSGTVRSLIHVAPATIQFGAVQAKTKPGRTVTVVNNRPGVKVNITGTEINDSDLSVQLVTIEEGRKYQVTVYLNPDAEARVHEAELTISTSDEQFSVLKVPVRLKVF